MNKRTINKSVTKKTSTASKPTTINKITPVTEIVEKEIKEVGTQPKQPITSESNLIDKSPFSAVFPLKFIEVPLDCFKRSSNGEIQHEPTRKQIEDILADYRFHSFNASFNRGQIILCFEKIW